MLTLNDVYLHIDMVKFFLAFFLFTFSLSLLLAQNYRISGKISAVEGGTILPGAGIRLELAKDSSLVKGVISGADGTFSISNLKKGSYILKVTYLGYQKLEKPILLESKNLDLGNIALSEEAKEVGQVEITDVNVRSEQKGDTTIYNANAFKVNPDATAEDLVTKMPGITNENGQIKANGENLKKVTVDGKEFFGDDVNAALKNLPADIVDRVQVFDRWSDQASFTGFDDGNSQKAMNIITRMGKNNGQFGKVFAGYGSDDRYNAGGNINFFDGDRRISILGMSNNINQQNFAMQDLLGVMGVNTSGGMAGRMMSMFGGMGGGGGGMTSSYGGGSGRGGGGMPFGSDLQNFMVGQQGGITTTHAIGGNYTDSWSKKLNVTGSYFFNQSINKNNGDLTRSFFTREGAASPTYRETSNSDGDNFNNRINLRFDYAIDSMNFVSFVPKVGFQNNKTDKLTNGGNYILVVPLSTSMVNADNKNKGYSFGNNLLFKHKFSKKGRTISINLSQDLTHKNGDGLQLSENNYYSISDSFIVKDQKSDSYNESLTLSANVTMTEALGKNGLLQVGYQPSVNKSNSDKNTLLKVDSTESYSVIDSLLSSNFDNVLETHKVAIGVSRKWTKHTLTIGADLQNVRLTGSQEFPVSFKVDKSFNNILPNLNWQYRFVNKANLRITYRSSTFAPTVSQLQPVINNTNPLFLSSGNPDLKQEFSNNISVRYNLSNMAKGTTLFGMIQANASLNYIGNQTLIASKDTLLKDGITLRRGSQYTAPINLDGYRAFRTMLNYGFPLKQIKSNLNLNGGFNYSRTPGIISGMENIVHNSTLNWGLALTSNISEKIDFRINWNANSVFVKNTNQPSADNNYYYQLSGFRMNYMPTKKWVINTELNHSYYTGLGRGYNQSFFLWNAYVGYKFLKNNVGEIKASVFDLLAQNNSINRTVTETYVEDSQTNVLTRYYMLTFTYTLRHYKGKAWGEEKKEKMPSFFPGK